MRLAVALAAGATISALTGCGTPGAPLPPSLNLPDPVNDLSAVRTGDQVSLTWTMPRRNTDKLALKTTLIASVCRKEGAGPCLFAGASSPFKPGDPGSFSETLPPELTSGAPRALSYFVELKNGHGRSAGLSNGAQVLAGAAPAAVTGLSATVSKEGVTLRWDSGASAPGTVVRLHRTLLTAAAPQTQHGPLAPPAEAAEQSLLVESPAGGVALDKSARFGETYAYRAQRVARAMVDGQTVELAGPVTLPLTVEVKDVFPPAVPTGLAAVATAQENGAGPAIDLSWQPDTEPDLAGYAVYRREGDGSWKRISPEPPVVGPGFHDDKVLAGHTYRYAVTAIDQGGHESARSAEAEETVPEP